MIFLSAYIFRRRRSAKNIRRTSARSIYRYDRGRRLIPTTQTKARYFGPVVYIELFVVLKITSSTTAFSSATLKKSVLIVQQGNKEINKEQCVAYIDIMISRFSFQRSSSYHQYCFYLFR